LKTGDKILQHQRKAKNKPVNTVSNERMLGIIRWLVPISIVLLTFVVFSPSLQNGFVHWDDDSNLLQNANYRGLSWTQLRWMFTTFHLGNYRPLTWITLGFDYNLWGMEPFGYHLTSLLLHCASALIFYFLAVRLLSLTQSSPAPSADLGVRVAAGLAALIFSLHPLRVEAVAWASARNHVLSSLFYLWAILFYLRGAECASSNSIHWRYLTITVILYGLSLLAQPIGITFPLILLILDVYPLKRFGAGPWSWHRLAVRSVWLEKIPFFLLAVGAGVIALFAKQEAIYSIEEVGVSARMSQALYGLTFYLWKTVVPVGLCPLYQLPIHIGVRDFPFILNASLVLAISVGLYLARYRWPAGLAMWVCYFLILSPVLGVAQYAKIVADRYGYLPCLGLALLAGAWILYCWKLRLSGHIALRTFVMANAMVVVVMVSLGFLTWNQVLVWRDTEALWRHSLEIGEETTSAHNNLGVWLIERGAREEAISHFQRAVQIDPANALGFYNLGNALARTGDRAEAIGYFRKAINADPTYASAHYNLGNLLAASGKLEEAIREFRETVRNDPTHVKAHLSLGNALAERGELKEAIDQFNQAVGLAPELAEAHESLARALALQGKRDEAVQHYQHALRILQSRRTGQAERAFDGQ
jgi:Flp pilus assembly protein TadD